MSDRSRLPTLIGWHRREPALSQGAGPQHVPAVERTESGARGGQGGIAMPASTASSSASAAHGGVWAVVIHHRSAQTLPATIASLVADGLDAARLIVIDNSECTEV